MGTDPGALRLKSTCRRRPVGGIRASRARVADSEIAASKLGIAEAGRTSRRPPVLLVNVLAARALAGALEVGQVAAILPSPLAVHEALEVGVVHAQHEDEELREGEGGPDVPREHGLS